MKLGTTQLILWLIVTLLGSCSDAAQLQNLRSSLPQSSGDKDQEQALQVTSSRDWEEQFGADGEGNRA